MGSSASTGAPKPPDVFLGGVCGSTTWRADAAIPALLARRLTFYNPQVGPGEWHDGMIALEAAAKARARVLLFVITGETSAIGSMVEAAALCADPASRGRMLLVVHDYPGDADVDRGRKYLRDCARTHGVRLFADLGEALEGLRI